MASSLNLLMFLLLLCFFFLRFPCLRALEAPSHPRCSAKDMLALLQFKDSFVLNTIASGDPLAYPKTKSWKMGRNGTFVDCCKWQGVECDARDGRVTSLDLGSSYLYGSIDSTSSLFQLVHLRRLNLADNDFNFSTIPSGFGRMTRLTHLNLSFSAFSGHIPSDILLLTRLVSLDLSASQVELKDPGLESLVRNLTDLQVLDLDYVTISAPVPIALSNLSSLRQLDLQECGLQGVFPSQIFQLPHLESIDLDYNDNLRGHLPKFNSSSPLKRLFLTSTSFSGPLPPSIGNLRNLNMLEIGGCKFRGSIPSSISNLTGLTYLSLGGNQFNTQRLSTLSWLWKMSNLTLLSLEKMNLHGQIPTTIGNLSRLSRLFLGRNQLIGGIPPQMTNLTQLNTMFLPKNNLSGPLPPWLGNMTRLVTLDLNSNRFEGEIPPSISQLENLQNVILHQNSLTGTVQLESFLKLKNLQILQLSFNRLWVRPNLTTQNSDVTQLVALGLGSCSLGEVPRFLQHQKNLIWIDLSDNNIHGQVPGWMWSFSHNTVEFMNLSRNFLTGRDNDALVLPHLQLFTLDLSHNKFKRPVLAPKSISYYFISDNELEGEFPTYFCELSELVALDFSSNDMSGILPDCLGNVSGRLSILNMQGNRFRGRIPEFSASADQIVMIELSDNRLEGKLPRSLANCTMLEFIGLANNRIEDMFPYWLGSLPELKVLILQSNKFHGVINHPGSEPVFQKLRIIDLSNNSFSGKLPGEQFRNWMSMKTAISSVNELTYLQQNLQPHVYLAFTYYGYYDYAMDIVYKGIKLHYPKISDALSIIDFSSNHFQGNIPDTVGELKGLQGLNFSNNLLTGNIPSSLGNLMALESLDLSNNKLSGQIPQSLAGITFLSTLNLSKNDLTGQIPRGAQFDNFPSTSFEGNPGLCGENIPNKCHGSGGGVSQPRLSPNTQDGNMMGELPKDVFWMIVALGCGSGLIVGWVLGEVFVSWKREWFVPKNGRRARRRRINRRN